MTAPCRSGAAFVAPGMTPERRRELLGDEIIAHIHREVAAAPPPSPELIERLRLIVARPADDRPVSVGRVNAPPSVPVSRRAAGSVHPDDRFH